MNATDTIARRVALTHELAPRVDRLKATHDHDHTLVGASSTAMLLAALTGEPVRGRPYDVWDLNRCERTYERAPVHLQERMFPTLTRFRALIAAEPADWQRKSFACDHEPAEGSGA